MFETGFLAGLIAKFAGLGSAAKAAIAAATAALTMTVAGGAAGVLPFPGSQSGPTVTVTSEPGTTVEGTTSLPPSGDPGPSLDGDTSATTNAGSTSATAGASGSVGLGDTTDGSIPPVTVPPVTVPGLGSLPDLSGLTQVPGQVLDCLRPVIDLVTGLPMGMPSPAQLAQFSQLGTTIVGCVSDIVADLPLPAGINTCVSNILAFVRNIVSQLPTATPDLGGFDVASCIPAGLPVPTGLPGMSFMGGAFPFGR